MTSDHVEDFREKMDKEKAPYFVAVPTGHGGWNCQYETRGMAHAPSGMSEKDSMISLLEFMIDQIKAGA